MPAQRMWPAGSQVGFAQLRPASVPHWLMWLLLPQHVARAEPGGLVPNTGSRHESPTNLEGIKGGKNSPSSFDVLL